jgi:ribosomal protein L40E
VTDISGGTEQRANERFCHNCGAANPPEYSFCLRCGKRINFLRPIPAVGGPATAARLPGPYPVRFEADYPQRLSRLSTFFRIILAIPLAIFVTILGGSASFLAPGMSFSFGLINFVLFIYAIAVLLRGRPPRWMFETIAAIQRFLLRAYTYFILMTDRYPPFDGVWPVRYEVDRPERISRWQILIWKTIMSIPHFFVLAVLSLVVGILTFVAWFAILFTGRYPQGLYNFSAGWLRWYARVGAYWMSLTDEFPPYSLDAEAGRGSRAAYLASAGVGTIATAGLVAGVVALFSISPQTEEAFVSYEGLLNGEPSATLEASGMQIRLLSAEDSYEFADGLFEPRFGNRFVAFEMELVSVSSSNTGFTTVFEGDFHLKDSAGDGHDPVVVSLEGLDLPRSLLEGERAMVIAIFEVPRFAEPGELTYSSGVFLAFGERAKFKFE